MSRNYDELTTVPNYNSTMHEDFEGVNDVLQMYESQMKTSSEIDQIELDERELVEDLENLKMDSEIEESLSERMSLGYFSKRFSNNKVFKSFHEKYPINIPRMSSQNTLIESQDENYYDLNTKQECQKRMMKINKKDQFSKQDLNKIYQELNLIHNKLVDEYQILQEREEEIKKRESKLKYDEERLLKLTQIDAKLHLEEIKENYNKEIEDLKVEFKQKFRDQKRLNEAFKTIKQTNENLKQQLNESQEKNTRLEKQNTALNNRLINLQKKIDNTKTSPCVSVVDKKSTVGATSSKIIQQKVTSICQSVSPLSQHQTLVHNANIIEAFAMLLDWLSKVHLKETINFSLPISNNNEIIEKSCRLLPLLAELIIHLNNASISPLIAQSFQKYHLAFLEFIYWSLLHYELGLQSSKINLNATFRRIGEELYRSYNKNYQGNKLSSTELVWYKNDKQQLKQKNDDSIEIESSTATCLFSLFLQGNNISVRMLSCLIILRTLSQADYINNVFEILRQELKDETSKKLFLTYFGTWTIIKWFKLTNKHLLNCSIDTYLQLSTDWEYLDMFLESCSNETWFSHIAVVLKSTGLQNTVKLEVNFLEKLSVLLQKLSKIRFNRKYFEMFSLYKICNDLHQKHFHDSSFLVMNLKSILFNLSGKSE